jgi:hypothetical protein
MLPIIWRTALITKFSWLERKVILVVMNSNGTKTESKIPSFHHKGYPESSFEVINKESI